MPMRSINVAFIAAFLLVFKAQSSDFLPHGWTEHSSNGVAYYHNQRTGITQWEKPVVHTQTVPHSHVTRPSAEYNLQPSTASPRKLADQRIIGSPQLQQLSAVDTHDNKNVFVTPNSGTSHIDNATIASRPLGNSQATPIISVNEENESATKAGAECIPSVTTESRKLSANHDNVQSNLHDHKIAKSSACDRESFVVEDYNAKLLIAEREIDDLNSAINGLEVTKAKLLIQTLSNEESIVNITVAANATAMSKVREDSITHSELAGQIEVLKSSLKDKNGELAILQASKKSVEAELVSIKAKASTTEETILELQSNFTTGGEELKASRELLAQQERELADAYKEIGQLEEDMRSVAGPSLKRLRQPSFFARILVSAFPVWVGGKGSVKSGRRAKGRAAAALAVAETAAAMNMTVESLRENLTAMASALTSKETIIEELSEQLVERTEEADMRFPIAFDNSSSLRYFATPGYLILQLFLTLGEKRTLL